MDCPKCKSTSHIKLGYVGGRQRHKCKNCQYQYTILVRGKPIEMKRNALKLYLEGMGFRGIGRFLGVSAVSVMNWVKEFGRKAAEQEELPSHAPIIELDEIHTYIGSKKTTFGSGQPLTDLRKRFSILKQEAVALQPVKNSTTR